MERKGKTFLFNKYEQDAQAATDRSLHSWRWNRMTEDSEFMTQKTYPVGDAAVSTWWGNALQGHLT